MIELIVKWIFFSLILGIIVLIGYRRGWWKGKGMGLKRAILMGLVGGILIMTVFDIVKGIFWNNSQEENVVETSSDIYQLKPIMEEDVIKMRTRLEYSQMLSEQTKFKFILPKGRGLRI